MKKRKGFFAWRLVGRVFFVALGIVALLFAYFNMPGSSPRKDVSFGVTFSSRATRDLGLDPRAVLLASFKELGVKKVRIPVYWDSVETVQGVYDYSDIDWQLAEAKRYQAEVILAVGQKVPRWPECFIPSWARDNDALRKERLVDFVAHTVERYRGHAEITMWQIENEPFLNFGECPALDVDVFDQEIATAKKADPSRPILTTDSGELSLWVQAASRGDAFGTTLYRRIKKGDTYFTYPIGPNFFRFKEQVVRLFTKQKNFMVIELQAEPWANGSFRDVSLDEQWQTMDERKFAENIRYARQVGFSDVYLWGVEWWYWLKTDRNHPELWDAAKGVFSGTSL